MTDIDWLAVSWVVSGTRITHLTIPEQAMVVRRLKSRIPLHGHPDHTELSKQQIADRLGITISALEGRLTRLPNARRRDCPICRQHCWIYDDNTVEPHPTVLAEQCILSGQHWPTNRIEEWEYETAGDILTLAQRLRHDPDAVWQMVNDCTVIRARELLICALAGVDPDTNPFTWLQQPEDTYADLKETA